MKKDGNDRKSSAVDLKSDKGTRSWSWHLKKKKKIISGKSKRQGVFNCERKINVYSTPGWKGGGGG